MSFNFVFDRYFGSDPNPNLAAPIFMNKNDSVLWTKFPYSVRCRLFAYCRDHDYPINFYQSSSLFPENSFYPIAIAFYNFEVDYFQLLPADVKLLVKNCRLKLLFYYHEGDNCEIQYHDLVKKCFKNGFPADCWRMISGNSQAEEITNFFYFPDHELQYWHVNRKHAPVTVNLNPRPHDFTLLSRTHKWWRASVVADLWLQGILSNSIWSYGDQSIEDTWENNPIDVSGVEGLETQIHEFVNQSPYRCDTLTTDQHNSHHVLVAEQFSNSYLHLVMETFFDADRSNGTFLTEKTFKPIKHGQPFIIIGPPGSLKKLRELGYRTFDNVIDPEYDTIIDNTQRWHCIRKLIKKLFRGDLHLLYTQCREDIQHNQLHFVSSKHARLKQLEEQLNAS